MSELYFTARLKNCPSFFCPALPALFVLIDISIVTVWSLDFNSKNQFCFDDLDGYALINLTLGRNTPSSSFAVISSKSSLTALITLVGTFLGAEYKKELKAQFRKNKLACGEAKQPLSFEKWKEMRQRMEMIRNGKNN